MSSQMTFFSYHVRLSVDLIRNGHGHPEKNWLTVTGFADSVITKKHNKIVKFLTKPYQGTNHILKLCAWEKFRKTHQRIFWNCLWNWSFPAKSSRPWVAYIYWLTLMTNGDYVKGTATRCLLATWTQRGTIAIQQNSWKLTTSNLNNHRWTCMDVS